MHLVVVAVSGRTSPSGVCRHAATLAHGMTACAPPVRVTVLAGIWQMEYLRAAFHLKGDGMQMVPVEITNNALSRNLWYLRGLPAISRALGADIIHLTFPAPVLRRLFSAKIVASLHDLYPFDVPENFGRRAWLNRAALRVCLRNADAVASVSRSTQKRLGELFPAFPASKSIVVPNPVALRPDQASAQLPASLAGCSFLLCVAQHRTNKNLPFLLRAFHLALQRGVLTHGTKLVIAGHPGPETGLIQQTMQSYGLGGQVLCLHDLTDSLLCGLYAACQVLVAPSLLEGFGLPVAEALALGCRVVCSDIPTLREVGGDACFYFDPLDASSTSLLEAIARACGAAPRRAPVFLTPVQAAEQYLSLYEELLRGPSKVVHPRAEGPVASVNL